MVQHQQQQPLLHKPAGLHAAGLTLPGPTAASVTASLQDTSRRQLSLQETRLTPPAGCTPAVRDFTAVSDVVRGILAACQITASNAAHHARDANHNEPDLYHMVYNIGRGQPASTVSLLHHLEVLLNKQAVAVNFLTRDAAASSVDVGKTGSDAAAAGGIGGGSADVWATWADMSAAKQGLGFQPRVGLQEGLREYVAWYKHEMCSDQSDQSDCTDGMA
jgi:nucleoside-diphosphate-sugar epimerase